MGPLPALGLEHKDAAVKRRTFGLALGAANVGLLGLANRLPPHVTLKEPASRREPSGEPPSVIAWGQDGLRLYTAEGAVVELARPYDIGSAVFAPQSKPGDHIGDVNK